MVISAGVQPGGNREWIMAMKSSLRALCAITLCYLCSCQGVLGETVAPQWSVGQDRLSGKDLAVTIPLKAPETLSLQEAINYALRYNVGFREAIQNLLNARSNWQVAGQRWDLTLSGSVERTRLAGVTGDEQTAAATFDFAALTGATFSVIGEIDKLEAEQAVRSLNITLEQPLLRGRGKASSAYEELRSARNGYRTALLAYYVSRQSLIEQVISAYFNSVRQQQLTVIQDSGISRAEQSVNDAQLRLDAGLIPEIDLTNAQLRLANARNAAVLQQQALADAMDNLLLILGLQVGAMPRLVTAVSYQAKALDLEAELGQAIKQRPEIRQAELSIEDRQAALLISRSNALPGLNVFGGWGQLSDGAPEKNWNLGLSVSLPIASNSLNEAVKRAGWDLLMAKQNFEDLRQRISAEVRSQVRAAQAAKANVDIALQSVELAKRSLHFAQRMVEEGLRTNRDLLDAQDDLTNNETTLVTNQINYYLALVRLRQAVGLEVSQDLPTGSGSTPPPAEITPVAPPP
jgi:outer membrane protein